MMTWFLPGPAQDLQSVLPHDPGSSFYHRSERRDGEDYKNCHDMLSAEKRWWIFSKHLILSNDYDPRPVVIVRA